MTSSGNGRLSAAVLVAKAIEKGWPGCEHAPKSVAIAASLEAGA